MPEQFRSLIYIVLLALITFFFAKKLTASVVSEQQFNRWRNTWIALTIIVFLAGNFWVYAILSALLLFYVGKQEQNPFALFLVLLFAIPRISDKISGLGVVNFLFSVDYITILSLAVLFPAYLSLRNRPDTEPFLRLWTDKILMAYMLLDVVLLMRDTTVTDALRAGVANFTDMFLPYYVASRGVKNLQQLKEAITAFVIAAMLAGVLAMFEYSRFWLLYASLKDSLGIVWEMGDYLGRGNNLRALASLGQPIILGYVMVIGLGCYLFLSKQIKTRWLRWLGWTLLLGGLYAPISRGPWVGALMLFLFFIAVSPNATRNLTKLAIFGTFLLLIIGYIPGGQKVMDMLPFIGKTDAENVDYRVRLIDSAYIVFNSYPWFGQIKFNDDLAALGMTQGEGIVDVVNTYLFELLEHGLVGLSLFISFFVILIFKLATAILKPTDSTDDMQLVGRVLLASIVATMVTITTVSSILVLPVVYWAVGGLSLAYCRMSELLEVSKEAKEFKSFRLAFDVMPAPPASRLVFSAFTTHRVIVDNNPIPRIKLSKKEKTNENIITAKLTTLPSENRPVKTPKPELGSLYQQARMIRHSTHQGYFAKTLQLPPKSKVLPEEILIKTGKVRVLSGSKYGKEFVLSKVLSKLGKTGIQVAVISKRHNGYYLTHLEGKFYPIVNNILIGERAHLLNDQDVIEILGIKMQFYSNETT